MAYIFLFLIAFISICPVMGDIPDNVLDSGIYEVMEHNGDDHLIDVSFSEVDSVTSCFGYTVTGNSTNFWVLTIDYSGVTIDRQVLNIQHDNPGDWISGVFLESDLLLVIDGESTPGALPDFLLVDLLNPGNSSHSVLRAEVASDEIMSLLSLEKFSDGELLAVGTRWSPENSHTLFVMKLDNKGTVLWETPVVENHDEQFSRASLGITSDGGCILSYDLDCFSSSLISIFRLGSDGQILWYKSLQVNSEFIASISGFLELGDGRILCTGTVDDMGQMAFRGFSVCLDSQGEELWRRLDWYNDHTLFRSAGITPQEDFLITGWTGVEGSYSLEVVDIDVLLAVLKNDGSRIIGTELCAEGDQKAHSVFLTESGQIIVTGTEVQPGKEEADLFFWKLDFEELQ